MTQSLRPWLGLALSLAGVLLASCGHGERSPHEVSASVADLRGTYGLDVTVNGFDGEARTVVVVIQVPTDPWVEHGECPVWDSQEFFLDDEPMSVSEESGLLGSGPDAFCFAKRIVIGVDVTQWEALDELRFRIVDATGESVFRFENFIRAPTVTMESPADGVLSPGDEFVLRFEPSVDVLPFVTMVQGGFGSGLLWGQFEMSDIQSDHWTAKFLVPVNARFGDDVLRFYTGGHPNGEGWRGGAIDCSDAISCRVRRVICSAAGCGSIGLSEGPLDDYHVAVPITVVP